MMEELSAVPRIISELLLVINTPAQSLMVKRLGFAPGSQGSIPCCASIHLRSQLW